MAQQKINNVIFENSRGFQKMRKPERIKKIDW
jgi:hypothetical protein